MFHSLTLVKIKYRSTKHLLKAFFEITFIDRYFAAKRFDCYRLANMIN